MSFYLEILANGPPIQVSHDENQRLLWSINFSALARAPVADWLGEVQRVLVDAALVTAGVDVFTTTRAGIPDGDGPFTTLRDTGGVQSDFTQQDDQYERRACQVVVRAQDEAAGDALAQSIWRELNNIRNSTITA